MWTRFIFILHHIAALFGVNCSDLDRFCEFNSLIAVCTPEVIVCSVVLIWRCYIELGW
jgi:hypothetical protein